MNNNKENIFKNLEKFPCNTIHHQPFFKLIILSITKSSISSLLIGWYLKEMGCSKIFLSCLKVGPKKTGKYTQ